MKRLRAEERVSNPEDGDIDAVLDDARAKRSRERVGDAEKICNLTVPSHEGRYQAWVP